jgi:CheY-like chemotaxis protein
VENLPGLFFEVARDGAILGASRALAEAFGVAGPGQLRGQPIGSYLPAAIPGSPLIQEIGEKGEIRDVPIRLAIPGGIERTAFLSARADSVERLSPCPWTGCLIVPSGAPSPLSSTDGRFSGTSIGADWDLLNKTRAEMQAQIDDLSLRFPSSGANPSCVNDVPPLLRSSVRLYSALLPRLEAMLALNASPGRHPFDARAAVAALCRASGRLLRNAGIDLIFDAQPAFPARVTACERKLTACVNLLLGMASTADDAREIVVQMGIEDRRFLSIEFVVRSADGAPSEQDVRQVDLANRLAATENGSVAVELVSPDCRKYVLRIGLEALDGAVPPATGSNAKAVNPALQALRVLIAGSGEGRSAVLAGWMKRQRADVTLSPAVRDVPQACRGVRPDIAILRLSECPELPEFLCNVPVLGLRTSRIPPPGWCRTSIEMPVVEEDLLEAVNALLTRLDTPAAEPQPPASADAVRILAVEDNMINQRVIQKMLAMLGYEFDVVTNGLDALAALRKRPYDAVLMDWEMPVMDGLEATSVIRQLPEPLGRLPIIAVTAHALPGDREACLNGGMNDYVSKPVNVELLRRVIEKWLPRSPRRLRREV